MTTLELAMLAAMAGSGCPTMDEDVLANGFTINREHSLHFNESGTPERITGFMRQLAQKSEAAAARLNTLVNGDIGIKLDEYDPVKHRIKKLSLEQFLLFLAASCNTSMEHTAAA